MNVGFDWKELAEEMIREFRAWGCRYSRKRVREMALGYECDPLFFWNWLDGEEEKSEVGFLRVLGFAFRKALAEEAEVSPAAA